MTKRNTFPPRTPTGAIPSAQSAEQLRAAESLEDDDEESRVVRRNDADGRGDRGTQEDAARDSELDNLMSDAEYEALVRAEFEQVSLPTPPKLNGWHLCWLTTTSQYDTISKRQRIGYRPVRTDEMPGFDPSNGQSLARYEGYVTCNELVLHKIPEAYYQKMMNFFHHKKPADGDNSALDAVRTGLAENRDSAGRALSETLGTGYLDMEESARQVQRTPRFS